MYTLWAFSGYQTTEQPGRQTTWCNQKGGIRWRFDTHCSFQLLNQIFTTFSANLSIVVYQLIENAVNLSFVNVLDGILVISLITETGEND